MYTSPLCLCVFFSVHAFVRVIYLVWIAQVKCWMVQEALNIFDIPWNVGHGLKRKPLIDNLERKNLMSKTLETSTVSKIVLKYPYDQLNALRRSFHLTNEKQCKV